MKQQYNYLWALVFMIVTSTSWAYGSSSSSKSCAKPKFTDFTPSENTEVAAGSGFSFLASANTLPDTIKVTVKGLPTSLKVTPNKGGFQASGTIPMSLKGVYARIAITANGSSNCKGDNGWLVKIAD
ncbi:hypothetical protein [Methylobacter svalbardensis]|uniref:hypothetical protein n=1 Tax=Methylobacter svalbardensis TaxID=3080016 RepID=UPI0030EE6C43